MASEGQGSRPGPGLMFRNFWAAQTVTAVGDQFSVVAIPLAAVLLLGASPLEMGVLAAAGRVPLLLFGLFAGVWVDSVRRLPLMIGADVLRAVLLAGVAVGLLTDVVKVAHLVVIAFVVGTAGVISNTANQAVLPALVPRQDLVVANTRITQSRSMAQVVGPSAGGVLVQWLGAPIAIVVDAVSFAVSALFLGRVRVEDLPGHAGPRQGVFRRIGEGLGVVRGRGELWGSAGCAGTYTFFSSLVASIQVLYLARELRVPAVAIGVVLAAVGPGALVGSLVAVRLAGKLGLGRVMMAGVVLAGVAYAVVPGVGGPMWLVVGVLVVAFFAAGFAQPLYNITQSSVRQAIVPTAMMGRVSATMQFIAGASAPLGAIIGGVVAQAVGIRVGLVVGAVGMVLAAIWLWRGGLSKVRDVEGLEPIASAP